MNEPTAVDHDFVGPVMSIVQFICVITYDNDVLVVHLPSIVGHAVPGGGGGGHVPQRQHGVHGPGEQAPHVAW